MNNFTYYAPTKVVFGKDTESKVAELIKEFGGSRVLVHYGGQSALKSGLISKVKKSLDDAGLFYVELGGVVPNPHLEKVREGAALAKENDIDFFLAVGGGSVIDSTKAIAYQMADPENDVWELFAHERNAKGCMPVGSVLTIAAAGSETSNSCVITNKKTGEKRAYDDDLARLTMSLPAYQTASGCTDIMMHTMERYFTQEGSMELTDQLAEALMRTVMRFAKVLKDEPDNYEARAEIMWAGSLAHNDLTGLGGNGGDWVCHMLEHELGGMFDVTHGAGLAAVWPSWARYVYKDCLHRFVRFAVNVMGVEPDGKSDDKIALAGISALEDFYRSIDMPVNLKELGIEPTEEQIKELAAGCAKATGGGRGTAKMLYEDDFAAVYKMAGK